MKEDSKMGIKMKGLKKALASALTLTMCLGATLTTMAGAGGTPTNQAEAKLSKTVSYASTLTAPTATFTFDFEKTSKDGITDAPMLAKIPTINPATIGFTAGETGVTNGGVTSITKATPNLLAGINWADADGAGTYVWTVTEQQSGFTAGTGENMDYSEAVFQLVVKVAYDPGSDSYYVESTFTDQTHTDNGDAGGGKNGADPGDGSAGSGDADYNFTFTNIYSKQAGGNPGGGAGNNEALSIGKTVTGTGADQGRNFAFTMTLNDSATTHTSKNYVGTVYNGATATSTTHTVNGDGTPITFNLKHGQRLVFHDVPVGAIVNVTETGTTNYTPAISGMVNVNTGTDGASLSTSNATIGTGTNAITFTNTFDNSQIPTGLFANNLPFIALMVAGIFAVAVLAVVNKRKAMR